MYKKIIALFAVVGFLGGCLMGPNYKKPVLDLPDSQEVDVSAFVNSKWWEMFEDPTLDKLEFEALENNKDLVVAMARVDEARANVGIASADQMPQVGISGDAGRSGTGTASAVDAYNLGLTASFELDLWGKYRRLSEAARAQLLSTESQKDTVRLALTADVARYYFAMVTVDDQLAISRRTLTSREETVKLYQIRYKNGYSTELELKRVQAEMASVKGSVAELERQLSQSETALAVLLGRSPREIVKPSVERGKALKQIKVIPDIPTELPADLLTRRPDVRQAEGQLIAANADVGAARAAYFPSVSLTAGGGYASGSLGSFVSPSTAMWNAAAGLVGPIFSGGKIKAQDKAAQARYQQMLATYEKAAQTAYKETYDALMDNQKYRETVAANKERKDALSISLDLSQKQKDAGLIGMLDLLDVERNLLQAELELATAERNQLNALVGVSQALGGGWVEETPFPISEEAAKAALAAQKAKDAPKAAAADEAAAVTAVQPGANAEQKQPLKADKKDAKETKATQKTAK